MSVLRRVFGRVSKRATPMPVATTGAFDLFGVRSAAGVTVTPADSLSISTVQACVSLIARSLASVPLVLYQRTGDGGRQPATEHPLYEILHDLANPQQTAFEVRQLLFVSALLYGNGYAEIVWNPDGYPVELWPLPPDQVQVYTTADRQLFYRVSGDVFGGSIEPRWLSKYRVHHLRGLATQGVLGLSPLRAANAVGLAMATEEFGARFFAQGARPGFILSHPGSLSDKAFQRLQANWDAGGAQNAHRTKIVEEGMKVERIGISPDEAQFLETRAFQVAEICRIFNVSPGLVGAAETQTYASAEQDLIRFRELTLGPWAKNHREAIQRDMLLPDERRRYFAQYKLSALQATDLKTRYEAHQIALLTGFETQNEVRELEDLNPVQGGDVLWRPLNMGVTGDPDPAASQASSDPYLESDGGDQGEDARATLIEQAGLAVDLTAAWVADVRSRLESRIANDVRQAGAKALRNGGRTSLSEWGETMIHEWRTAGDGMLAALHSVRPGTEPDLAQWVAMAYQAAVRELINGNE